MLNCKGIGQPRQTAAAAAEVEMADTALEQIAGSPAGPETEAVPETAPPQPAIRFTAIPENPRPGEPVTVALALDNPPGDRPLRALLIGSSGRQISKAAFFRLEEGERLWAAVLAIPSLAAPGSALIRLEEGGGLLGEILLTIENREFLAEEIALNANNTALRTEPDPQKTAEAERLWAILNTTGAAVYSGETFQAPVSSTRRTSFFGDRRVYRYSNGKSDTSVHAGIDYGVPLGTEVAVCAAGKVALARPRIVTGNSVIIEHLPGLYSLYYHLDSIRVAEGDLVEAGTLLGTSGATGLATGPHLHWEIRAAGENADPDAFMARPVLDKTVILSKLVN